MKRLIGMAGAIALSLGTVAWAGHRITPGALSPYTGTQQSSQLYTPKDPQATGGLRGKIAQGEVLGVFAIPQDKWRSVYLAWLGDDGTFAFQGLPAGKYDLAVLFENRFVEGLALLRRESTLTAKDRKSIQAKIEASNAFFNEKRVERCEGITGHAGQARALLQELRSRPVTLQSAEVRADIQIRSIKIVLAEDVNLGWTIQNTREIVRQEIGPGDTMGMLPVRHADSLRGIRVLDTVKDLGELDLP
ncbi:MAG: hypothetical protein ACOX5G_03455 [Kiritimatiellia bacterium]